MDTDVQPHSFLKDLLKPQLAALSKIANIAQFKAGKPIFRQGESADRFFLIEQGRVSLDYNLPHKRHETDAASHESASLNARRI